MREYAYKTRKELQIYIKPKVTMKLEYVVGYQIHEHYLVVRFICATLINLKKYSKIVFTNNETVILDAAEINQIMAAVATYAKTLDDRNKISTSTAYKILLKKI